MPRRPIRLCRWDFIATPSLLYSWLQGLYSGFKIAPVQGPWSTAQRAPPIDSRVTSQPSEEAVMSNDDAVLVAVRKLQEEQHALVKSIRWRAWAIAGWAVAAVLLLVILVGFGEYSAAKDASKLQQAELLKTVDKFNALSVETNRTERMLVTYANGQPPAPARVTTMPAPPTK